MRVGSVLCLPASSSSTMIVCSDHLAIMGDTCTTIYLYEHVDKRVFLIRRFLSTL